MARIPSPHPTLPQRLASAILLGGVLGVVLLAARWAQAAADGARGGLEAGDAVVSVASPMLAMLAWFVPWARGEGPLRFYLRVVLALDVAILGFAWTTVAHQAAVPFDTVALFSAGVAAVLGAAVVAPSWWRRRRPS